MNKEALIQNPKNIKPHVVLLGAGASRAAFPNGEESGKKLPLMDDFAEILGLGKLFTDANINPKQNFEATYQNVDDITVKNSLEEKINKYFLSLTLPNRVTDYDRLLLSLREKDAIFTFNWDPFLFDAYVRNRDIVKLPEIFFLHGNVRIGYCEKDNQLGRRLNECPTCHKQFSDVPLLYPIRNKNYSGHANRYIREAWNSARILFKSAFTLSIFGYGAPTSDSEAIKLLHSAWLEDSTRKFEHIEIIDTAASAVLHERWHSFTPTNHYQIRNNLSESRLLQWPRRSCEALHPPMMRGEICEAFPLTLTDNLSELQKHIVEIARYEN
ncbi:MAG TPA: hypothetical protein VNC84_01365 [Gammaproteobacteria bacterium]|jgi:hypothetical protein|nr:hypothetical protein [Gammaproteobacteria bacterium]